MLDVGQGRSGATLKTLLRSPSENFRRHDLVSRAQRAAGPHPGVHTELTAIVAPPPSNEQPGN